MARNMGDYERLAAAVLELAPHLADEQRVAASLEVEAFRDLGSDCRLQALFDEQLRFRWG